MTDRHINGWKLCPRKAFFSLLHHECLATSFLMLQHPMISSSSLYTEWYQCVFLVSFFSDGIKTAIITSISEQVNVKKNQVPCKVIWKENTMWMYNSVCPGWQNLGVGWGGHSMSTRYNFWASHQLSWLTSHMIDPLSPVGTLSPPPHSCTLSLPR